MATKRTGGTNVRSGFYWNLARWEMVTLARPGGILPGGPEDRYLRVPVFVLLALAPVMGGLYVMFLPLIGFAMVLAHLARKSRATVRTVFMEVAVMAGPHWAPGEAYLAGKRRKKGKGTRTEG